MSNLQRKIQNTTALLHPAKSSRKSIMETKRSSSASDSSDTEEYLHWLQEEKKRASAATIRPRDVIPEQQKKMMFG